MAELADGNCGERRRFESTTAPLAAHCDR